MYITLLPAVAGVVAVVVAAVADEGAFGAGLDL